MRPIGDVIAYMRCIGDVIAYMRRIGDVIAYMRRIGDVIAYMNTVSKWFSLRCVGCTWVMQLIKLICVLSLMKLISNFS